MTNRQIMNFSVYCDLYRCIFSDLAILEQLFFPLSDDFRKQYISLLVSAFASSRRGRRKNTQGWSEAMFESYKRGL